MSGASSRPGGRPTLADVAERAGVSPGTASLALRGAAGPSAASVERVRAAASALGYRADRTASRLAARRTRLLGVTLTIRNTFHAELAEALQDAAEDAGYQVLLHPVTARRGEAGAVEVLLDSRCEALLLLGSELPSSQLAALDAHDPVVLVGRRAPGLDVVRADEAAGTALVVEHLAELGHTRLAHVSGGGSEVAHERRDGFLAAARSRGLDPLVVEGSFSEDAGAAAVAEVLAAGATGVFAANDRVAVGLLDAVRGAGPREGAALSVVGYDDSPLARLGHVRLTSVSQDPAALAAAAVRTAVERLDGGREDPVDVVLAPHLVVRGSTGRP
ncbi:LacI family DNA-binding transcriptional regulator [Quadrisphaera setariae]|uniref:LacI family transcriptional regulator n=1 Tax=Quadrisphaera setariae TaxID=2593304 RepID=A0A5C8Z2Z3_9ACTN|nr:LacI family DNA-binding transcriptional regulator [Quadrisphaera setariae]TXR51618.1 LacI family transcriptional regulator [Quadrisphaera setariae]